MQESLNPQAEAGAPASEQRPKLWKDRNLRIIFGVTLMVVMGVTSIAPVLQSVAKAFDLTPEATPLLITLFTLPGVFLMPVVGFLADRVGRKQVLVPSLFLFGLAGAACALTSDFHVLLALRFIQGLGAAPLGALNVTIIGDLYSGNDRAAALGLNAAVLSFGVAAYPALGGALAMRSWHAPFLLPILAIPLAFIVIAKLDNPEPKHRAKAKTYFLDMWKGVANRKILAIFLGALATFIIIYGVFLTYLSIHLGDRFGASTFSIGLILSLAAVSTGGLASQLGRLTRRIPELSLVKFSYLVYAASALTMAFMPSLWWYLVPVSLLGLGQGLNLPCIQSLLTSHAPMENRAGIMSLYSMVLRLGQTVGPLIMAGAHSLAGIQGVFYAGVLVALLAFAAMAWLAR